MKHATATAMPRLAALVALLCLGAVVGGCGSSGGLAQGADPNYIGAEEIEEAATAVNARVLVERLRPRWLYVRRSGRVVGNLRTASDGDGGIGEEAISVYVNRSRLGTSEQLASIPRINVRSMRYLTPSQAIVQFGTTNGLGAIVVETAE